MCGFIKIMLLIFIETSLGIMSKSPFIHNQLYLLIQQYLFEIVKKWMDLLPIILPPRMWRILGLLPGISSSSPSAYGGDEKKWSFNFPAPLIVFGQGNMRGSNVSFPNECIYLPLWDLRPSLPLLGNESKNLVLRCLKIWITRSRRQMGLRDYCEGEIHTFCSNSLRLWSCLLSQHCLTYPD